MFARVHPPASHGSPRPRVATACLVGLMASCAPLASPGSSSSDVDTSPLSVLPADALALVAIDVHAAHASRVIGPGFDTLMDRFVPLGDDSGFRPARDADRVLVALDDPHGRGPVALVQGRFRPDAITAGTQGRDGSSVEHGRYHGFDLCLVGAVAYAPLTDHTLVVGLAEGVRALLERVERRSFAPPPPPWVTDALGSSWATFALAADVSTHPALASTPTLAWAKDLKRVAMAAGLGPPGLNVVVTLSFPDAVAAQRAAVQAKAPQTWLRGLPAGAQAISIRGLDVTVDASDVRCTLALDEASLRELAALAPRLLPPPSP